MKRKEAVYKGLEFIDVYFNDTSATSPDYFQITEFPTRLTAGKNLFKLRGHPSNLKVGGVLNFEVLDFNGNPIYSEVIDFIDEDKSRVIAIYIYSETSPGDCTITLLAEAATINGQPVPAEWQGRANVKWTRTVPVNPNISNVSEIIFENVPTVTVQEQIGVQLDRTYATTQFPTYSTGTVRYFLYNNQPAVELTGGAFTSDMSTGTITVSTPINPTPTPNYAISTTPYVSSIKKILNPTVALLDTEYTALSSQSISIHRFSAFDASSYSLTYEATPTYVETENSQSFAYIEVFGLEPATGDVSRVKVFTNNNGTVGTWELINDIELEETEIFVPSTSSLYPDKSIGIFTSQSIINTYWEGKSYNGVQTLAPATLTWTTASIENGMRITSSSLSLDAASQVLVAQIKSTYAGIFLESSSYKVSLDAIGTTLTTPAKLSIYLSGSSFYQNPTDFFNQTFSTKLGKRIGELYVPGTAQRFDDQTFSFEADYTGTGTLLLVVESGDWIVSDIHVTSDNDAGYSPNYTRIKSYVPTTHKIDNQLDFKVEYYNVNGERSKQISYVRNKDWEGGNRYIDGNYSMLTGSLYVADSLNSGVAISGYPNAGWVRSLGYEGYAAGYPGFLIWSGSALPGSAGTKGGVPYSGVGIELYANTASYFRYSTTDSEIDVRTDKFFFGNPSSSYISGSNGLISISASNFVLSPQGNVTASNADFRGTAIADIITDRSISITTANSSSYITYYTLSTGQNASRLYLDGSLGGQKVRRVTFNCNLRYPLGKITTPGQKLEVILTNQYDYVVPPPGYTGPYNVTLYDLFTPSDPSLGVISYDIKSIPAGDTVIITNTDITTDAKLQTGGSITLFDHIFSSDVIISGSATISTGTIGSTENTLTLGIPPAAGTGEGGQLGLNAPGGSYTSASFIDNYQNSLRILKGTNAGSTTALVSVNLHTGNMTLNNGSIIMPSRPAFRVSGSTTTGIAATTTITATQGAAIDYNIGGYYNNTTGIFTAPISGLYHVYFNCRTQTAGTQQVIIYKNTTIAQMMWETNSNTGHFGISSILSLSANDTLLAKVTGGTVQFDNNDNWGVSFIG